MQTKMKDTFESVLEVVVNGDVITVRQTAFLNKLDMLIE